jgi:hypothetical protein
MTTNKEAKDIVVKPISSADAAKIVRAYHYSGKTAANSQLHFGVFLDGKCGGAMQFGPSLDKSKMLGIVKDTKWNGFLELNRMAFSDWLPRNSESRALGVALRMIKKNYPHIEWVVSFSDGTQCGDGTIYRASGFVLTQIRENKTILKLPNGEITTDLTLNISGAKTGKTAGWWKKNGAVPLKGFQLRYIYFLNPEARSRLTVPEIPFSEIKRRGASMYLGKANLGGGSIASNASDFQSGEGG